MYELVLAKNIFLRINLLIFSMIGLIETNLKACATVPRSPIAQKVRSESFYEPAPLVVVAALRSTSEEEFTEEEFTEFEFGGEFRADSASSVVSAGASVTVQPEYSSAELLARNTALFAEALNLRRELELERAAKACWDKDARRLAGLQENNKALALERNRLLVEHESDRKLLEELRTQFKVLETVARTRPDMCDVSTNTTVLEIAARPALILARPGASRKLVGGLQFRLVKAAVSSTEAHK